MDKLRSLAETRGVSRIAGPMASPLKDTYLSVRKFILQSKNSLTTPPETAKTLRQTLADSRSFALEDGLGGHKISRTILEPGDVIITSSAFSTIFVGDERVIQVGNNKKVEVVGINSIMINSKVVSVFRHLKSKEIFADPINRGQKVAEYAQRQLGKSDNPQWGTIPKPFFRYHPDIWCNSFNCQEIAEGTKVRAWCESWVSNCKSWIGHINLGTKPDTEGFYSFHVPKLLLDAYSEAGMRLVITVPNDHTDHEKPRELRLSSPMGYVGHLV